MVAAQGEEGLVRAPGSPGHVINYRVNNSRLADPRRPVSVEGGPDLIATFADRGYVLLPQLFDAGAVAEMRSEVDAIAAAEADYRDPGLPGDSGPVQYLRWLLDKTDRFDRLFECEVTRGVARAMLGPQVQFENVDARVAKANAAGQVVPWHIHLRVVPDPLPPFFCYPHAIHGLLYLDDVGPAEGPLCVLPGSHRQPALAFSAGDTSDQPGQALLTPSAGDCVLIHANLWHRTLPATSRSGDRRLLLFSFAPSWLRSEQSGGLRGKRDFFREQLAATTDPERRELLGEFRWC